MTASPPASHKTAQPAAGPHPSSTPQNGAATANVAARSHAGGNRPIPSGPYSSTFTSGGWAKRGPGFVREMRREAMRAWLENGYPTTRMEAWRHTNLRDVSALEFAPAEHPMRAVTGSDIAPYRLPGVIEMVFVDGQVQPHLGAGSQVAQLPDGLRLEAISKALTHPDENLESHLGRYSGNEGLVPLNTAFFTDGAYLVTAPGLAVQAPIHLLHVATEPHAPTACHVRHLIVAGARSSVTVIESYVGLPSPDAGLTTTVTEVVAGPGAQVTRVKLQRENTHAYHFGHVAIRSDRDAVVADHLMTLGAALSRHEADVVLGSPGAEVTLNGLFLATGSQHVDCTTRVDHAVPHTTSRELYKGILDGESHGVFLGNVQVRADAQKTNAAQTNRNLLLSRTAGVDTTPQLEIHADDVKCSHGSTIGALREDALFFLRSRGIAAEPARLMLTKAFAQEVLESAPATVRPVMEALLTQWFACRKVAAVPRKAAEAPSEATAA